jgi:hypothetical protein
LDGTRKRAGELRFFFICSEVRLAEAETGRCGAGGWLERLDQRSPSSAACAAGDCADSAASSMSELLRCVHVRSRKRQWLMRSRRLGIAVAEGIVQERRAGRM